MNAPLEILSLSQAELASAFSLVDEHRDWTPPNIVRLLAETFSYHRALAGQIVDAWVSTADDAPASERAKDALESIEAGMLL